MAFTVAGAAQILSGILPTLQPLVAEIEQVSRSSPATVQQVQTAMNGVEQGLAALAAADSMSAAGPIIQRIETDTQAILTVASQVPLPGTGGMVLRVAMIAVPTAFMIVNMILASQAGPPAGYAEARNQARSHK